MEIGDKLTSNGVRLVVAESDVQGSCEECYYYGKGSDTPLCGVCEYDWDFKEDSGERTKSIKPQPTVKTTGWELLMLLCSK